MQQWSLTVKCKLRRIKHNQITNNHKTQSWWTADLTSKASTNTGVATPGIIFHWWIKWSDKDDLRSFQGGKVFNPNRYSWKHIIWEESIHNEPIAHQENINKGILVFKEDEIQMIIYFSGKNWQKKHISINHTSRGALPSDWTNGTNQDDKGSICLHGGALQ